LETKARESIDALKEKNKIIKSLRKKLSQKGKRIFQKTIINMMNRINLYEISLILTNSKFKPNLNLEDIINSIKQHLHQNPGASKKNTHHDYLENHQKERTENHIDKLEPTMIRKNSSESKYKQKSSFFLQEPKE
jgi:hypothetical protein